jgi:hypothetical protein
MLFNLSRWIFLKYAIFIIFKNKQLKIFLMANIICINIKNEKNTRECREK